MFFCKAVMLQHFLVAVSAAAKGIIDPHKLNGPASLCKSLGNRAAQTAYDCVLLRCHHAFAGPGQLNDHGLIQRLDGTHIHHPDRDFPFQLPGGRKGQGHHISGGKHGHIRALLKDRELPYGKRLSLLSYIVVIVSV